MNNDDKHGCAIHKGKLMDRNGWQDANLTDYVLASDYEALRVRFEKACEEITRLSAPSHVAAPATEEQRLRKGYGCQFGCMAAKDLAAIKAATSSTVPPLYHDALCALVELVRLKRIKDRMEQTGIPGGPDNAELSDLEADYKGSKQAAWAYAKSVADGAPVSATVTPTERDALIEKCAKLCEEAGPAIVDNASAYAFSRQLALSAGAIRALKAGVPTDGSNNKEKT